MSSVIEELVPFDCLNSNELSCPQPLLSKQRWEFPEFYAECIWASRRENLSLGFFADEKVS